jgi:hypothetical protein
VARKYDLKLIRYHGQLYEEDWDFLKRFLGPGSKSRIGAGPAVREIVHAAVGKLKAKIIEKTDARRSAEQAEDLIRQEAERELEQ